MIIWVDAQLSPSLAKWVQQEFQIDAIAVRELGLREASDQEIFAAARKEAIVVMTKDADFLRLLEAKGAPPKVMWITCGNTSNAYLKMVLKKTLQEAINFLNTGENLVEISDTL